MADSPGLLARALLTLKGSPEAALEHLQGAIKYLKSPSMSMSPTSIGEVSLPFDSSTAATDGDAKADKVEEKEKEKEKQKEEDLSRQQLEIIKAKTMYQMVEEIGDEKCKLLFVSSHHAPSLLSRRGPQMRQISRDRGSSHARPFHAH